MDKIDFNATAQRLQEMNLIPTLPDDERVYIRISDAGNILRRALDWVTRNRAVWLPEYERIAEWLTDNHGRGLLMYGNCGRGKSLFGYYVIPVILNHYCRKVVSCTNAQKMNDNADDLLARHILYIDDIGTESVSVQYGNRRLVFPELVDAAERKGKLLIASTNLSLKELTERYGDRTADRLRSVTTQVLFQGESLRK